jgi:uncharacterized membrane protein YqiK
MRIGESDMLGLYPVVVVVGIIVFVLFGLLALLARFYRQVDQGRALVINTMRSDPVVAFTGAVVYPIINRAEVMDLSVKTIDIDRRGKEGLICNDNIRADINVTFFVRVNKTVDDVLKVAQSIGCQRASDPKALETLFTSKFAEALKTVGKHFNFEELYTKRDAFKDKIIEVIGKDLNGFILDDAAIDYLEQTPIEHLDKDNIMDADGIRKITDLTVIQNVKTNELRQKERMEMGSQNLNADEALFRFEQRRAEAEAKKNKEISVANSREQNEAQRVSSDEVKKTALISIKNAEESQIAEQAKERGVAIAQKHREREIAVEQERVEKARQLEVITREREVALVSISRDKEVEVQKKEIANVVRERISVEKSVAAEEELIKDIRTVAQANRDKDVVRIAAEAVATEASTKQVKAAQASEEVTKIKARERVISAEAELDTADKVARSKFRMAEGVQAEAAAEGLARARVKEADAVATEKLGLTEARVALEKLSADASGQEKQGLAKVRVREAEAQAVEKQGVAEAAAIREKLTAEAQGLAQKAASMKALDEAGRGHEEFRLQIDKERTIALESLKVKREVMAAQAQVLAEAMGNARINIVGGDGQFFQRFVSAISLGQSVDGALEQSDTLRAIVSDLVARPDGSGNGNGGGQALTAVLGELAALSSKAGKQS